MAAAIVAILLGLVEVFAGRRLFWIFVAIGGFLLGWFLVPGIFPEARVWSQILIGVPVGLLFALLAILVTRPMVALAGFFVFAAAAVWLLRSLGAGLDDGSVWFWIVYVIGGVVGAVLLYAFFDWALVILTSLGGAWAVTSAIGYFATGVPWWLQALIFIVLAALGIAVQSLDLRAHPDITHKGRQADQKVM